MDLRELHRELRSGKDFSNWAKKRLKVFIKGEDYEISLAQTGERVHGGHNRIDYAVSIECAKHIAMMEQTEWVRQVRQYFIEFEKALKAAAPKQETIQAQPKQKASPLMSIANGTITANMPSPETLSSMTMSSVEIAAITGKNHADVMRDIRVTMEQAGIDESKFAGVYLGGNGQERPCYHLPRFECDLVVSGYSVKYRMAIIKRWHYLEEILRSRTPEPAGPKLPMDYIEALEALTASAKANLRLENKFEKSREATKKIALLANEMLDELEVAAPKVEFFDDLMDADGLYGVNAASKILNISLDGKTILGEIGFYKLLRSDKIVGSDTDCWNSPMKRYVETGFFKVVLGKRPGRIINHKTGERRSVATQTTKVTPKGLAWLKEKYKWFRVADRRGYLDGE